MNTPVPFTLGDRDRLHTIEINLEATNRRIDDLHRSLEATNRRMLWIFGILIALGGSVFAYLKRQIRQTLRAD